MVIDPEAFMGREIFEKITGDILRQLRSSKVAPGEKRIYTAGEKEYLVWLDRKDKGVPLGEAVRKELIEIWNELEMDFVFLFETEWRKANGTI